MLDFFKKTLNCDKKYFFELKIKRPTFQRLFFNS